MKNIITSFICSIAFFYGAYSQTGSIPNQTIDTIIISSSRIKSYVQQIPAAVSVITTSKEDATRQQLSLQEYVQQVPGVFTQNANNFAQDLRISIRGFGARSSFGIRGIKLIVDGIPETTPDGQGQLDNINLGIIDRIEITKGASASLYGNASGGVIDIATKSFDTLAGNSTSVKAGIGAFGFQNYQATATIGDANTNYTFHGNYATSDGYRDQSGFEQINTNFKGQFKIGENTSLTAILNYADSPQADDPGGLTLEEVNANRRQARDRNVQFKTGEAIEQFKVGTSLAWNKNENTTVNAYAFYSNRQFNGLLPFEFGGIVDLSRNYLGQGTSITYKKNKNTIRAGYDFAYQNDRRNRFRNLDGEEGGQTLGQREKFTNLGIYVTDHLSLGKLLITAGARFDYNKLSADDDLLDNGDDSGSLTLNSFNPSVGVSYAFAKALSAYMNVATSFETPSLSELSSNPDGSIGFNENLKAQKAASFEVGLKGTIASKLQYQLAAFLINTKDDLVPFELAQFPDREFFRNAGKTKRHGVEVEASYRALPLGNGWLNATGSYTYSDFTYDEFETPNGDFDGNFLPGIAKHMSSVGLQYAGSNGFNASVSTNFIGEQFAQDSNETTIDGYELVNVRASYETLFREVRLKPYIGVNNVLDQKYTDNVRINAFGGKFYEPAPGLTVFGGITLEF
ncbi:TonB-dependent receptor family protein [Dokdonia sp. Asnod1-B02]|uniref:TonB-dependent receptor family protein n=1 Tax=Dokdonia sp. Asnod1-B02 TaxID=3160573 RepID=UPI003864C25D